MELEAFIARWLNLPGGAERANAQPFLSELADALGLPRPDPAIGGTIGNYRFEAPVTNISPYGSRTKGAIDLYKRGCFILEAKQSQLPEGQKAPPPTTLEAPAEVRLDLFGQPILECAPTRSATSRRTAYDKLMAGAFDQARGYALSLPPDHPTPPFLIVADIGRAFEIYFDWSGNGRGYGFFPSAAAYRIALEDLRDPDVRTLFRQIWTEPAAADPRNRAVEVTREIATRLAKVAKRLEADEAIRRAGATGPQEKSRVIEETSLFVIRLLFCMFAEDVGLIPDRAFLKFLEDARDKSDNYWKSGLTSLWAAMGDEHAGRYWPAGDCELRYFNGNLFSDRAVYPLPREEKGELAAAARQDWRRVEPAIFGTFLEQALEPAERSRLGAHYTPRAYVQRLVSATILDVLEPEWEEAQAQARAAADAGDLAAAAAPVTAFLDRLAATRVLDPACGTGNFLYVALESLLRLESRARDFLAAIGRPSPPRVMPEQFLGLELNPRAALIAEIVIWIGWLRFRLESDPETITEPILARAANINFGRHAGYDALLAMDEFGQPDLANPRPAAWPEAEFIVGNPPFMGGKDLRARLRPGYAEAIWKVWPAVPRSADLVMQWWSRAATELVRPGTPLRRFGFVTTNSITQTFSRRVVAHHLGGSGKGASGGQGPEAPAPPVSLTLAIPDHPWTKATRDAAAVRIAMTVAEAGTRPGTLLEVGNEEALDTDSPRIETKGREGHINADLTIGADSMAARRLQANAGICHDGVKLHGRGFAITRQEAEHLGLNRRAGLEAHIRPYRNGKDLAGRTEDQVKDKMVIDLFGLTETEVRQRFPEVYQHLLATVKPARDAQVLKSPTPDAKAYAANWWIMGKPRPELRPALAGLPRYIATVDTAKHRVFQFLPAGIICDDKSVIIGSDSAFYLGVLSSRIHTDWALHTGGWLGVGNDPVYVKSKVFDPFPFPDATPEQQATIATLAEELDSTRKAALAENPGLTMTALYNMVEDLKSGTPPTPEATKARAAIVRQLHAQIDEAVATAYGWPNDLPAQEIVARLVALNATRAAEEAKGHIRYLRPDFQTKGTG
ncbi:MAG: DNA methyltransferase [Sphingomonadaceae bacterium]